MSISAFENPDDSSYVRWMFGGQIVEKRYSGTTYGVVLASGSGVVIVEPYAGSRNNAVIFNADGTERVRLTNPLTSIGGIMVAKSADQFGCVFDEQGQCIRTYETR